MVNGYDPSIDIPFPSPRAPDDDGPVAWEFYTEPEWAIQERAMQRRAKQKLATLRVVSPQPPPQRLRRRSKLKRFDLPLLFKKEGEAIKVMACPDSGSDDNIISESFAKELGLQVKKVEDNTEYFSLANGKTVRPIGRVSAHFSFALGSPVEHSLAECTFYVFSSLAVSVIMGMEFLERTETLTKHTDRMIEQPTPTVQALRVNSIGVAKKSLVCRLGTYTSLASPDTGSDLDLINPKFARDRAFDILPAQETIQFADCSIGHTSGVVQVEFFVGQLDDCEGFIRRSMAQVLEFHVLDNLAADILLGQESIESLNIFSKHADSIIPSLPSTGESDVNIIRHIGAVEAICSRTWSKFKNKDQVKASIAVPDLNTAHQRDNARREETPKHTSGNDTANARHANSTTGLLTEESPQAKFLEEHVPPYGFRRYTGQAGFPASTYPPGVITGGPSTSSPPATSSGPQPDYFCSFPGCNAEPFHSTQRLAEHADVHVPESRPHLCSVRGCPRSQEGMGFEKVEEVNHHSLVHKGLGYACPFCLDSNRRYPQPHELQSHVEFFHFDADAGHPILQDALRCSRPGEV